VSLKNEYMELSKFILDSTLDEEGGGGCSETGVRQGGPKGVKYIILDRFLGWG